MEALEEAEDELLHEDDQEDPLSGNTGLRRKMTLGPHSKRTGRSALPPTRQLK